MNVLGLWTGVIVIGTPSNEQTKANMFIKSAKRKGHGVQAKEDISLFEIVKLNFIGDFNVFSLRKLFYQIKLINVHKHV